MNTIDNIMALADDYVEVYADRQALRAAIEQALTPVEPAATVTSTRVDPDGVVRSGLDRELPLMTPLYTAPQPRPKQEPAIIHREIVRIEPDGTETWRETPLYTAPQPQREWVGLTDDDVKEAVLGDPIGGAALMSMMRDEVMVANVRQAINRIARAIEAKLREKNGGGEYSQDTHQPSADTHQPCNPAGDGVCEALECCKNVK